MQFLYPTFLWALVALALPIIVHLFYFKRFKRVEFTNVRLLREVKEETASRNKLKDLLILLARLLALAFLVLAFAQPFIPRGQEVKAGSNAVSIFIDNSFSMNAVKDQTPIVEIAKQKAREILAAYGVSDRFQILSHEFTGNQQRLVNKEDALTMIDDIEVTPRVRTLKNVLQRQQQVLEREDGNRISYILSDFQESICNEFAPQDTTTEVNLIPIQSAPENNITIDSVWLESGLAFIGQSNKLLVKISNIGNQDVENVRLSILKDGQEKPEGQLNIDAGSSLIDTIVISINETGWHTAQIKISDYPIQFDDNYWISFYVEEELKVLTINDGSVNRYLGALFEGLDNFTFATSSTTNVNYGALSENDLVIIHDVTTFTSGLSSALRQYINEGGKLLFFPQNTTDITSINSFLSSIGSNTLGSFKKTERQVFRVNTEEFIFKDVFGNRIRNMTLPIVSESFDISTFQSRNKETILSFRDGGSFIAKYPHGNGIFYLASSPLNPQVNNLVLNAEIFVPMVFKMAIAKSIFEPLAYTIGKVQPIEVYRQQDNAETVYAFSGPSEFIPSQTTLGSKVLLTDGGQVEKEGIYEINNNQNLVKKVAFNYNRIESDLALSNPSSLSSEFNVINEILTADFTSLISEKDKGVVLWKWCLILALIFLAIETVLLRLWKK